MPFIPFIAVYHAQAYRLVICGIPMKCQESPRREYGSPLRQSCVPLSVHSLHPNLSYLVSRAFLPPLRRRRRAYRSGDSGVHGLRCDAPTLSSRVRTSPGRSFTEEGGMSRALGPTSHFGTGAPRISLPARFIHSSTSPDRVVLTVLSVWFERVTLRERTPCDTFGWIYTSSIDMRGRLSRYTSCHIPAMWVPHMEPEGISLRPTDEGSSKTFCDLTPTSISASSPAVTTSVMSASKGRNRSKFSATFLPFTYTSAFPATASKWITTLSDAHSEGTLTTVRSQAARRESQLSGYDGKSLWSGPWREYLANEFAFHGEGILIFTGSHSGPGRGMSPSGDGTAPCRDHRPFRQISSRRGFSRRFTNPSEGAKG